MTHAPQLATKYELSKHDAKIMLSIHVLNMTGSDTFLYIHSEGILSKEFDII